MTKFTLVWVFVLFSLLWGHSAQAANYYVAQTGGSDARSCATAQTLATPKLTVASGVTCLAPGDTLYIRQGTYAEHLENVPTGTSWSTPVTIMSYPGETATLTQHPTVESAIFTFGQGATAQRYIILQNLTLDGLGGHSLGDPNYGSHLIKIDGIFNRADHIRIQNNTLKRARMSAVLNTTNTTDPLSGCCNEYLNNEIGNNGNWANFPAGADFPPALYVSAANNLFEYNNVHHSASVGIDIWNSSVAGYTNNVIARYNSVWANGIPGGKVGVGIMITKGSGTLVHNNLVYGNTGAGIASNYDVSNISIYNNTIYGTVGDQYVNGACIHIGAGTSGTALVRNNICWNNAGSNSVVNGGSSATITQSNNSSTNPNFVNAAADDFHLQASSTAAVNQGFNLTSLGLTSDFEGTFRPQGSAFDIGAYEFTTADTTPPTVTGQAPVNGATGVPLTAAVTVTFSETMDSATITNTKILLKNPALTTIPATVSYTGGQVTALLTPNSPLAASTVYTVTVLSGASGVKDSAGNALVADAVWSFTTGTGGPLTLYVATTGSNSNDCTAAQNPGTPKQTITAAFGCIGTGSGAGSSSIVQIAAGDYAEHLNESVNGGTSWANALQVRAAPGASVWLKPSGGAGTRCVTLGTTSVKQYVIFDGINCDATAATGEGYKLGGFNATSGHMQITNAEIMNGGVTASPTGLIYANGTEILIDHCNIHHARTTVPGLWITASNSIVEYNDIHDNGRAGIDTYLGTGGVSGNIYRYNTIRNNIDYGILLGSGDNSQFYNNLIYNTNGDGLWLAFGGTNNQIYNNTIWNNLKSGGGRCMLIESPQSAALIRNNICYQNTTTNVNTGTGTVFTQNLCGVAGTGCAVVGNPTFANAAVGNFALLVGSPAIDQGSSLVSSVVTTDFVGTTRPQNGTYDIGAYEYVTTTLTSPSVIGTPVTMNSGVTATMALQTVNATCPSGSTNVVAVACLSTRKAGASAITLNLPQWNSVNMTVVPGGPAQEAGNNGTFAQLYYQLNPTCDGSPHAFTMQANTTNQFLVGGILFLKDVSPTTPFDTAVIGTGTSSTPPGITVTGSASGDLVVDCVTALNSLTNLAVGPLQTGIGVNQTTAANPNESSNVEGSMSTEPSTGSSVTMNWTVGNTTASWAQMGASFNPVTAATVRRRASARYYQ